MAEQKKIESPRKLFILEEENGNVFAKLDAYKDYGIGMIRVRVHDQQRSI